MKNRNIIYYFMVVAMPMLALSACTPTMEIRSVKTDTPEGFGTERTDTINSATMDWRRVFNDPALEALIDTALKNNQELNIMLQEIEITRNEIRERKGEYLPTLNIQAGSEVEKVGRYTRNGAVEATTDIRPDEEFPEPLGDFLVGGNFSWELDVWKKLRNQKKAAVLRYLSTEEGRNFMVTRMVAEIASAYYELLALDNQLQIVDRNIEIQENALGIVRLQKQSAKVTELAVKRFEAEVLKTTSLRFEIQQKIIETENEIHFLTGCFPNQIARNAENFLIQEPDTLFIGIPAQLLENRPDIKQAELELEAAKLDVKAAKAAFYPSFGLQAHMGFQAFKPEYLLSTPASLAYSLAGDLLVPLINRNAIKANFYTANSQQLQAIYNYEQRILKAYVEVVNLQSQMANLKQNYVLKRQQVDVLRESIDISTNLFKSAKADYVEVLMTQRETLEATMELVDSKRDRYQAFVNMYQALGGGWNR